MLHDITEFEIRDGLSASYDIKPDSFIFRIIRGRTELLAVSTVTEHEELGVNECYCQATKMDSEVTIKDFRVLFEHLKFHIVWFKRSFEGSYLPCIINNIYFKNKYGTKERLMEVSKKLKRVN